MDQATEGLLFDHFLRDTDRLAVNGHFADVEEGLLVFLGEAIQQLIAGGDTLRERGVGERGNRVREQFGRGFGPLHHGVQERAIEFMQLIKHS